MMFQRISHRLAAQFTAFVFLLLMLTGAVFLAADLGNARRMAAIRMERTADDVFKVAFARPAVTRAVIPPHLRDRVRIVGADGRAVYEGGVFEAIPFNMEAPRKHVTIGEQDFVVFTKSVVAPSGARGFVQLAEAESLPASALHVRVLLYVLISIAISGLTYVVGLFFAHRSLRPARQAVERLEQFTQDASHELRTPLATMNSTLDLALKTKEYPERIKAAKKDIRHMSSLVERLLELARLDRLLMEPRKVHLSDLARRGAESFARMGADKNVAMKTEIKPNVSVQGDPALIRQMLDNLIGNALKFCDKKIEVTLTDKTLSVRNDGATIPAETLPRVFDRFFQADESRSNEGFGLGLALVKRIVEIHGWSIEVESSETDGTVFEVHFG